VRNEYTRTDVRVQEIFWQVLYEYQQENDERKVDDDDDDDDDG